MLVNQKKTFLHSALCTILLLLYSFLLLKYIESGEVIIGEVFMMYLLYFSFLITLIVLLKKIENRKQRIEISLLNFAVQIMLGYLCFSKLFALESSIAMQTPWALHLRIFGGQHCSSGAILFVGTLFLKK